MIEPSSPGVNWRQIGAHLAVSALAVAVLVLVAWCLENSPHG